ncbi:MAG: ASCH domain-containing protein [Pseudomonadota bacterium]
MPALNFQKRFADDVERRIKRQTVRAHRKDNRPHCKVGDRLKLYTGMRTKKCRLLDVVTVTRIDTIKINTIDMWLNGNLLHATLHSRDADMTDDEFAEADGFDGFMDMAAWFAETHGLPFEGVVIYWGEE